MTKQSDIRESRVVEASFEAGATQARGLPGPTLSEVAFAGRSNVGKSSLLNGLLQRKSLVRTSRTPGCTRQLNLFSCKLADGLCLRLVDLPGYGYAKLSKSETATWQMMIEGYLRERPTLRAVVLLLDVRRGLQDDDRQLLEFVEQPRGRGFAALPLIIAATKLDKLPASQHKPATIALRKDSRAPVVGFSAVTLEGREELWAQIRAVLPVAQSTVET